MERRGLVVDVLVALVAFAVSAAILGGSTDDAVLRDPDALAYALLAVHSGSVVLRRSHPMVAVGLGLATGLRTPARHIPSP